jgi:A/G-specific adenine glycosylase
MSSGILDADFIKHLLQWYEQHQRTLPWRQTRDFYHIWLSEIMLQQTRVKTVIPYYLQWLQQFPSIEAVAQAGEEEILKAWEGLGYYRRALLFLQACRRIMNDHHGSVPENPDTFRRLPGIGPYSFAAVRSIFFHDPIPAVDGNVRRVISRMLRLPQLNSSLTLAVYQALLKIIPVDQPGDFNQALMDLGSSTCTPRNPRCDQCPVSQYCQALQNGQVSNFPVRRIRLPLPHHVVSTGIIWRNEKFLICKRPTGGLLGGLWELPGGKVEPGESLEIAAEREIREETGLAVQATDYIGAIRHAYTHFSVHIHIFHCAYRSGKPRPLGCTEVKWIKWVDIQRFPFPKANHKLFAIIQSAKG